MLIPENQAEAPLIVQEWGFVPYQEALERQLTLVHEVAEKDLPGYLVFCSHPPIVTKGRSTRVGDIFDWSGETLEVSRGGRATYHGPSQLIVYPIVNLKFARKTRRDREVVGFIRDFENALVDCLAEFQITTVGRSLQKNLNSEKDETGIWYQNQKLASIGIAVKKWVTYHGAALNITQDKNAFSGINPCGFSKDIMISLEEISPSTVKKWDHFISRLKIHLQSRL